MFCNSGHVHVYSDNVLDAYIFFLKYSYPVLYIRDILNSCLTVNDVSVEK